MGLTRVVLICLCVLITACMGSSSTDEPTPPEQPPVTSPPETPKQKTNIIVFFTDDQGFADLGIQNQLQDLKTPNIDSIARAGITATNAYVTAPQCTPSRAAIHTGLYQQRFGVDDNRYTPMPLDVTTIGERMTALGYTTGMVGKWHLEIDQNSDEWAEEHHPELAGPDFSAGDVPMDERKLYFPNHRGYQDVYFGYHHQYWATYDQNGETRAESYIQDSRDRILAISDAAVKFIDRHHDEAFFLHIAHFAPHVPLAAAEKYLDRFPGDMENRRRYALAMMSAIDDGVGDVLSSLAEYGLLENTLVIFMSDNGAPLGLEPTDAPIEDIDEAWNGSYNTPLIGEKGMLTDGGIRVPFVAQWPGMIPAGKILENPVSSLDIGYTALRIAGAETAELKPLDGLDLMPAFLGEEAYLAERTLFWRFWSQSAARKDNWKYLRLGNDDSAQEFLFDLNSINAESENLIEAHPDIATALKQQLSDWESTLKRTPQGTNSQEIQWYDFYLNAP